MPVVGGWLIVFPCEYRVPGRGRSVALRFCLSSRFWAGDIERSWRPGVHSLALRFAGYALFRGLPRNYLLVAPASSRGPNIRLVGHRFSDRFDESTYADDEPIHILNHNYGDGPSDVWVPERLWHRLLAIGSAYFLHYVPLLTAETKPRSFNSVQAEGVLEELEFVTEVVSDALLREVIATVTPVVEWAARYGGKEGFVVEGP